MNVSSNNTFTVSAVDNVEVSLSQTNRLRIKLGTPGGGEVVVHMTPNEAANVVQLLEAMIQLYRGHTTS